jgi:hypothetical protein
MHIFLRCSFHLRISTLNERHFQSNIDHSSNQEKVKIFIGKIKNLIGNISDNQLHIVLFDTTLTGVIVFLNYYQRKKKKMEDEQQVCFIYFDHYFIIVV